MTLSNFIDGRLVPSTGSQSVPVHNPSTGEIIAETPLSSTLFQALFQGLGPGFLAVIFFALSTTHLGPTATAGFSAVVPATAALLAIPVLYEIPTTLEWAGIVTVTSKSTTPWVPAG